MCIRDRGIVMMLFLGFGITVHSGVWGTLGRIVKRGKPISRKEKRALILAGCIPVSYTHLVLGEFNYLIECLGISREYGYVYFEANASQAMAELLNQATLSCQRRTDNSCFARNRTNFHQSYRV